MLLFIPFSVAPVDDASAEDVGMTCTDNAYDLVELVDCICAHKPPAGSEGYVIPPVAVRDDWRAVVWDMLEITDISQCDDITLPSSLDGIYDIIPFHDAFDGHDYCVAMEVDDADDDGIVDRGWGTFIVNPTPERYLSIDITHPVEDNDTDIKGAAVFKGTQAHTFVMGGSNRGANSAVSPCQSDEVISDPAHSIDNLFFPTVVEIDQYHAQLSHDYTSIQFHGMHASSCSDVNVYITHGSEDDPQPGDSIVALKDSLLGLQPSWSVANPGEPGKFCDKNGTDNVEGRYLNSGDEGAVCGSDIETYNGKFIHVELDPDSKLVNFRNADIWSDAINDAFPPLTAPPPSTTVSFQDSSTYSGATDTWIRASSPGKNYGTRIECEADDDKAALLRWDISTIPTGSTIREATITLDITNKTNRLGYYAHPLLRDWDELGATWVEYVAGAAWDVPGAQGFFDRVSIPSGKLIARVVGPYTFSINPDTVQEWIDDPGANHGLLLANPDNSNGVDFHCREASAVADRPMLTVVYE